MWGWVVGGYFVWGEGDFGLGWSEGLVGYFLDVERGVRDGEGSRKKCENRVYELRSFFR